MTGRKALGKGLDALFSPEESESEGGLVGLSSKLIVNTEDKRVKAKKSKELSPKIKTNKVIGKNDDSEGLSPKVKYEDLTVKTEESGGLTSEQVNEESIVKPRESKDLSLEAEVKAKDVIVNLDDSEVHESSVKTKEVTVNPEISNVLTSKSEVKPEMVSGTRVKLGDKPEYVKGLSINLELMDSAIAEARENARLGIYSPVSSAVLRYKKKTTPEFSISDESRILLEEAVAKKYPELTDSISLERKEAPDGWTNGHRKEAINAEILMRVVRNERNKGKLTVWSPYVYAALKYLRKTVPEFSMSMEARVQLEEAVARRYPDIFEEARKALESD
jgi:hypothetical protein